MFSWIFTEPLSHVRKHFHFSHDGIGEPVQHNFDKKLWSFENKSQNKIQPNIVGYKKHLAVNE